MSPLEYMLLSPTDRWRLHLARRLAMGKAKHGFIFKKCPHCNKLVEVKYYAVRKWHMVCPNCKKEVSDES